MVVAAVLLLVATRAPALLHCCRRRLLLGRRRLTLPQVKKDRKNVPQHIVMNYMVQMTLALEYMHQHRVLHRDIKVGGVVFAPWTAQHGVGWWSQQDVGWWWSQQHPARL